MKVPKFLFIGGGILVLAILSAIVVFFYVQSLTAPVPVPIPVPAPLPVPAPTAAPTESVTAVESVSDTSVAGDEPVIPDPDPDPDLVTPSQPSGDIPLRSLSLTPEQSSTLETFGIDVETFVITADMLTCAETAVGVDRMAAFKAGASPGFLESLSLFSCLRN